MVQLLGDEGHEGMEQLQTVIQTSVQHGEGSVAGGNLGLGGVLGQTDGGLDQFLTEENKQQYREKKESRVSNRK